jgi:membrane-bound serine protease (ClpP class)
MPGVDTTEAMDEKSNSFIRGKYRALGEANGHEPLLGEAMVDRNIEVRAYRNADDGYYFFRSDQGDSGDGDSNRRDLLDQILDAVSEDGESGEEIGDLLRKVLGAEDASRSPAVRPQSADRAARKALDENTILVSPRGELLTLTSREAVQFGLAESITTDVDDTLREHLLGSIKRLEITPTWDEALFAFLTTPTIAGLLLMAGLGGLYVEARTPGFGAPGINRRRLPGPVLRRAHGHRHGELDRRRPARNRRVAHPRGDLPAARFRHRGRTRRRVPHRRGLYGARQRPLPEFAWEIDSMRRALYTLTVGLFSFGAFVVGSAFLLPYTPLGNFLVLSTALQNDAGYTAQCAEESATLRGLVGVATTPLRPAGKGRFGTRKVDVVTRGEFLDQDTPIQIILSDGNRYVVTRYDAPDGSRDAGRTA